MKSAQDIFAGLTGVQRERLRGLLGRNNAREWQDGDDRLKELRLVHLHVRDKHSVTTELNNLGWTVAMIADDAGY